MTRIIAGQCKGRRLQVPDGHATRPTSDRLREAWFSALDSRDWLVDTVVLDLFAGSGALGLEAASRGAKQVTLVDHHAGAIAVCRNNVQFLGLSNVTVVQSDVATFLERGATTRFDLVLADPPYDLAPALLDRALTALVEREWLAEDAIVVVERARRSGPVTWPPGLLPETDRRYGESWLWWGRTPEQ